IERVAAILLKAVVLNGSRVLQIQPATKEFNNPAVVRAGLPRSELKSPWKSALKRGLINGYRVCCEAIGNPMIHGRTARGETLTRDFFRSSPRNGLGWSSRCPAHSRSGSA